MRLLHSYLEGLQWLTQKSNLFQIATSSAIRHPRDLQLPPDVPPTQPSIPDHSILTTNPQSSVHTEYIANYLQKDHSGNHSVSKVTGNQEIIHGTCSDNWNDFAEKCANLIKDLVASLANAVSSKPGDTTNLQLHIKNSIRHFDNSSNCSCTKRPIPAISKLSIDFPNLLEGSSATVNLTTKVEPKYTRSESYPLLSESPSENSNTNLLGGSENLNLHLPDADGTTLNNRRHTGTYDFDPRITTKGNHMLKSDNKLSPEVSHFTPTTFVTPYPAATGGGSNEASFGPIESSFKKSFSESQKPSFVGANSNKHDEAPATTNLLQQHQTSFQSEENNTNLNTPILESRVEENYSPLNKPGFLWQNPILPQQNDQRSDKVNTDGIIDTESQATIGVDSFEKKLRPFEKEPFESSLTNIAGSDNGYTGLDLLENRPRKEGEEKKSGSSACPLGLSTLRESSSDVEVPLIKNCKNQNPSNEATENDFLTQFPEASQTKTSNIDRNNGAYTVGKQGESQVPGTLPFNQHSVIESTMGGTNSNPINVRNMGDGFGRSNNSFEQYQGTQQKNINDKESLIMDANISSGLLDKDTVTDGTTTSLPVLNSNTFPRSMFQVTPLPGYVSQDATSLKESPLKKVSSPYGQKSSSVASSEEFLGIDNSAPQEETSSERVFTGGLKNHRISSPDTSNEEISIELSHNAGGTFAKGASFEKSLSGYNVRPRPGNSNDSRQKGEESSEKYSRGSFDLPKSKITEYSGEKSAISPSGDSFESLNSNIHSFPGRIGKSSTKTPKSSEETFQVTPFVSKETQQFPQEDMSVKSVSINPLYPGQIKAMTTPVPPSLIEVYPEGETPINSASNGAVVSPINMMTIEPDSCPYTRRPGCHFKGKGENSAENKERIVDTRCKPPCGSSSEISERLNSQENAEKLPTINSKEESQESQRNLLANTTTSMELGSAISSTTASPDFFANDLGPPAFRSTFTGAPLSSASQVSPAVERSNKKPSSKEYSEFKVDLKPREILSDFDELKGFKSELHKPIVSAELKDYPVTPSTYKTSQESAEPEIVPLERKPSFSSRWYPKSKETYEPSESGEGYDWKQPHEFSNTTPPSEEGSILNFQHDNESHKKGFDEDISSKSSVGVGNTDKEVPEFPLSSNTSSGPWSDGSNNEYLPPNEGYEHNSGTFGQPHQSVLGGQISNNAPSALGAKPMHPDLQHSTEKFSEEEVAGENLPGQFQETSKPNQFLSTPQPVSNTDFKNSVEVPYIHKPVSSTEHNSNVQELFGKAPTFSQPEPDAMLQQPSKPVSACNNGLANDFIQHPFSTEIPPVNLPLPRGVNTAHDSNKPCPLYQDLENMSTPPPSLSNFGSTMPKVDAVGIDSTSTSPQSDSLPSNNPNMSKCKSHSPTSLCSKEPEKHTNFIENIPQPSQSTKKVLQPVPNLGRPSSGLSTSSSADDKYDAMDSEMWPDEYDSAQQTATTFQTTSLKPTSPQPLPQYYTISPTLHPNGKFYEPTVQSVTSSNRSSLEEDDEDEDECCSCESESEEISDPKQFRTNACRDLEEARRELKAIFDKIRKKLRCCSRKPPKTIISSSSPLVSAL